LFGKIISAPVAIIGPASLRAALSTSNVSVLPFGLCVENPQRPWRIFAPALRSERIPAHDRLPRIDQVKRRRRVSFLPDVRDANNIFIVKQTVIAIQTSQAKQGRSTV
jgi:hypothetical protein